MKRGHGPWHMPSQIPRAGHLIRTDGNQPLRILRPSDAFKVAIVLKRRDLTLRFGVPDVNFAGRDNFSRGQEFIVFTPNGTAKTSGGTLTRRQQVQMSSLSAPNLDVAIDGADRHLGARVIPGNVAQVVLRR